MSVQFTIIFFDDSLTTYTQLNASDVMKRATAREVANAEKWVNGISVGGGTDVQTAMSAALKVRPAADVIFLLTDGEIDPSTAGVVRSQNVEKARINTIAFQTQVGESLLKQISKDSGGDYRFVP